MSARAGQCQCGAVTFTANEVRTTFGACHCKMCQQLSGGIFLTANARGVTFSGEENITPYRSSSWAERGFCKICGSHLYYRLVDADDIELCIGVFDDPSDFVLASEIFIDRKPPGYALAGDHPRLTEAETLAKYPVFDQ